jgi:hypothetical protein
MDLLLLVSCFGVDSVPQTLPLKPDSEPTHCSAARLAIGPETQLTSREAQVEQSLDGPRNTCHLSIGWHCWEPSISTRCFRAGFGDAAVGGAWARAI